MSISFSLLATVSGIDLPPQSYFPSEIFNGYFYFSDQSDVFYRTNGATISVLDSVAFNPSAFAATNNFCAVYDNAGNVQISTDGETFDPSELVTFDTAGLGSIIITWHFGNTVMLATDDGPDTNIYTSPDGINFTLAATYPGVAVTDLIGSLLTLGGTLFSYPAGIQTGIAFYDSVNGYDFTERAITVGSSDITTVIGAVNVSGYMLTSGVGLDNKLYSTTDGYSFTLENSSCFSVSRFVPMLYALSGTLYAGLGYTNPPLVALSDLYIATEVPAVELSNQGAIGGGINGAGGAVGFSRILSSPSFGPDSDRLAYPSGILPVGVNDFGIDLGL